MLLRYKNILCFSRAIKSGRKVPMNLEVYGSEPVRKYNGGRC